MLCQSLRRVAGANAVTRPAVAAAAGNTLANYYYVYNQEYNALVTAKQRANNGAR